MIPILRQDLANHYFYGSLAAYLGAGAGLFFGYPPGQLAQASSTGVGLLRELYNWKYTTGFSWDDWTVTSLAGTPLLALFP